MATIAPAKINRITVSGEDSSFNEVITLCVPIVSTAKYSGEYNCSDIFAIFMLIAAILVVLSLFIKNIVNM